ncbi:MAG TPA: (2Fe-2S)-binding protein [Polyangiaceae bacterium]|jgi:sarcosine oxidase subunit alpha
MARLAPPRDPVTLRFDGEEVVAERGEPVAVSLLAAGDAVLARSAKFHRPRGPSCLRAACDGCLARVDGEPNVMTCRVPAAEGVEVETQNVVGSRDTDLLRMADWFFPEGMNHHELFAGVPGVQRVMQAFARRVAGLGRLPRDAAPPQRATRRAADVLVVGAGAAGMMAAVELARRGRKVEVVDDALAWGGSVRALPGAKEWDPVLDAFGDALRGGRLAVRLRTTAAAVYGEDVLVAGLEGVEVVNPRTLVLAPGAHDGVLAFEGNDVPGVMSARAGGWLLAGGVTPGKRVVVAVAEGGGPFGDAFARVHAARTRARAAAAGDAPPGEVLVVREAPIAVKGSGRVKSVVFAGREGGEGGERREERCDALLLDAPRSPAYELCAQAGAELAHEPRGFVVRTGPGGRVREGVFAVGEVVGTPLDPASIARAVAELAPLA